MNNLTQINNRLSELAKELDIALRRLHELELIYNRRYYELLMISHMTSAERREAEAILALDIEGLYKPFIDQKIELRTLLHEKEILIEMSRNMRALREEE